MRVLTRKVHQSVIIGDEIEVFILEVRGEQVRLGVRTPRNMTVRHRELYPELNFPDEGGQAEGEDDEDNSDPDA